MNFSTSLGYLSYSKESKKYFSSFKYLEKNFRLVLKFIILVQIFKTFGTILEILSQNIRAKNIFYSLSSIGDRFQTSAKNL